MKSRVLLLFGCCVALWVILLGRAARLQIFPDYRLANLKRRQFETSLQIHTRRGAITDRNGVELAASVPAYSLFADPKLIENPRALAPQLSRTLEIPVGQLAKRLRDKQRRFIWIKRQLSERQRDEIRAWGETGLAFVEEPKRVYPQGSLLAQVLGFVGAEGTGLEGLELQFNKELSGQLKTVMLPRDARGRPLLEDARALTEVPDGADIQLTIDHEVQFTLERELSQVVEKFDAESAVGVVMDAQTSEIIAAANLPTVDLNEPNHRYPASHKRDRLVTDAFEPGSTLKTFMIAGGLRDNMLKPGTKYNCEGGRMKVGDKWITEAETREKFGWLTVSEILARSSNVGAAKIGLDLGAEKVNQLLSDFGFGQKTGIELPGEARGIMNPLPWRPHLLSNIAFGQGIAVTTMQMVAAYGAIANGGVLKRPLLVHRVRAHDRDLPTEFQANEVRRVMSPTDAATMRLMLMNATEEGGTGQSARIPGYHVAGKTGTAQKVDVVHGGYVKNGYVSSFAGFVPASSPRYVIYVAVDYPKKGYYGSQVAAPAFAKMAQYLVRRAGLPPVLISESNVIPGQTGEEKRRSLLQRQALNELKKIDPPSDDDFKEFPNLLGLTLREALYRVRRQASQVSVRGHGLVVRTLPLAGVPLRGRRRITLVLENPD